MFFSWHLGFYNPSAVDELIILLVCTLCEPFALPHTHTHCVRELVINSTAHLHGSFIIWSDAKHIYPTKHTNRICILCNRPYAKQRNHHERVGFFYAFARFGILFLLVTYSIFVFLFIIVHTWILPRTQCMLHGYFGSMERMQTNSRRRKLWLRVTCDFFA